MKEFLAVISGKKTYIVSGATIVYCVLGVLLHFMTLPAALAFIGTAGSISALRSGVGKVEGILEVVVEILKLLGTPATETPTVVTPVTPVETPVA